MNILSAIWYPFSLFYIAWKSIRHRFVPALLTIVSMALGVTLIVVVLTMFGVITDSFRSNSSLGYDLVVGAKGGKMQLTLNSVFYLSQPIETIPYEYYLEFYGAEDRFKEYENSIAYRTHQSMWNTTELDMLQAGSGGVTGPAAIMQSAILSAMKNEEHDGMKLDDDGRFSDYADLAIPICLGDYFNEFRAVATNPDFFTELVLDYKQEYNPETEEYDSIPQHFTFAEGNAFEHEGDEYGFFGCVVGSVVARTHNVKLGDYINPTHGAPDGHTHKNGFTVVGILDSTGTPNDRAVFINIEGFFLMEDHAMTLDKAPDEEGEEEEEELEEEEFEEVHEDKNVFQLNLEPLPMEQRQVSAVLVRSAGLLGGMAMERPINKGVLKSSLRWSPYQPSVNLKQDAAQAVSPIKEIELLVQMFVNPVQYALLFLTAMICIVSGISILVSIYNSMAERRREIAVMRSLGAGRTTVMTIILFESIILSVIGGLLGWVGGHALNAAVSPFIEARTGVSVSFFDFAPPLPLLQLPIEFLNTISPEWLLIPSLIVLAILVGLYPAITAYRTDVSKSL